MRSVFLIRHGEPDFPRGQKICLGQTDLPLSQLGRMQACLLAEKLNEENISAVFSSPLLRAKETAGAFSLPVHTVPSLTEQNMGVWDGLSFDKIRNAWPELYLSRADSPLLVPPGAETLSEVRSRALPAFEKILRSSADNIAVVAHASVIQAILASLTDTPPEKSFSFRLPYSAYALLQGETDAAPAAFGILPDVPLTPALAEKLLLAAAPGENVIAHCRAVAEMTRRVASALPGQADEKKLRCAALLHDAARALPNHAEAGAKWVERLGYSECACLIRVHHDLPEEHTIEEAVLFLCDKCVQEDKIVPIRERFAHSALRCRDKEAENAHARRFETALRVQEEINARCGMPLIP